jgi:hypothetical protein
MAVRGGIRIHVRGLLVALILLSCIALCGGAIVGGYATNTREVPESGPLRDRAKDSAPLSHPSKQFFDPWSDEPTEQELGVAELLGVSVEEYRSLKAESDRHQKLVESLSVCNEALRLSDEFNEAAEDYVSIKGDRFRERFYGEAACEDFHAYAREHTIDDRFEDLEVACRESLDHRKDLMDAEKDAYFRVEELYTASQSAIESCSDAVNAAEHEQIAPSR